MQTHWTTPLQKRLRTALILLAGILWLVVIVVAARLLLYDAPPAKIIRFMENTEALASPPDCDFGMLLDSAFWRICRTDDTAYLTFFDLVDARADLRWQLPTRDASIQGAIPLGDGFLIVSDQRILLMGGQVWQEVGTLPADATLLGMAQIRDGVFEVVYQVEGNPAPQVWQWDGMLDSVTLRTPSAPSNCEDCRAVAAIWQQAAWTLFYQQTDTDNLTTTLQTNESGFPVTTLAVDGALDGTAGNVLAPTISADVWHWQEGIWQRVMLQRPNDPAERIFLYQDGAWEWITLQRLTPLQTIAQVDSAPIRIEKNAYYVAVYPHAERPTRLPLTVKPTAQLSDPAMPIVLPTDIGYWLLEDDFTVIGLDADWHVLAEDAPNAWDRLSRLWSEAHPRSRLAEHFATRSRWQALWIPVLLLGLPMGMGLAAAWRWRRRYNMGRVLAAISAVYLVLLLWGWQAMLNLLALV